MNRFSWIPNDVLVSELVQWANQIVPNPAAHWMYRHDTSLSCAATRPMPVRYRCRFMPSRRKSRTTGAQLCRLIRMHSPPFHLGRWYVYIVIIYQRTVDDRSKCHRNGMINRLAEWDNRAESLSCQSFRVHSSECCIHGLIVMAIWKTIHCEHTTIEYATKPDRSTSFDALLSCVQHFTLATYVRRFDHLLCSARLACVVTIVRR